MPHRPTTYLMRRASGNFIPPPRAWKNVTSPRPVFRTGAGTSIGWLRTNVGSTFGLPSWYSTTAVSSDRMFGPPLYAYEFAAAKRYWNVTLGTPLPSPRKNSRKYARIDCEPAAVIGCMSNWYCSGGSMIVIRPRSPRAPAVRFEIVQTIVFRSAKIPSAVLPDHGPPVIGTVSTYGLFIRPSMPSSASPPNHRLS